MKRFVEDMLSVLCHALASTDRYFDVEELMFVAAERLERCIDTAIGDRANQPGMMRDDCKLILVAVARECITIVEGSDGP